MGMTAMRLRERRQQAIADAPRPAEPKVTTDADRLVAARAETRKLKARIAELEAKKTEPIAVPEPPPQPVHTQAARQDRPQQNQKFRRG